MAKDQYVLIGGGRDNIGDALIVHRVVKLLESFKPDRKIAMYLNCWEDLTPDQLQEINDSKAVIMVGGPSLRNNLENIYKIFKNIDAISVPIIPLGIGWKDRQGDWTNTHYYLASETTKKIFEKIDNNGYFASVRDYHSLNVLLFNKSKNVLMTGCPALYDLDYIDTPLIRKEIKNVSFSVGLDFSNSNNLDRVQKECILKAKEYFKDKDFTVVFHQSLENCYNKLLQRKQQELAKWLKTNNIKYVDISGNKVENLINHYSNCDLHIGFRVHAHIFMNSVSKPSILIAEDGRGKALRNVISGLVLDSFSKIRKGHKKVYGIFKVKQDIYEINQNLADDLINNIDYELKNDFPRISLSRRIISSNFEIMKRFMAQLP